MIRQHPVFLFVRFIRLTNLRVTYFWCNRAQVTLTVEFGKTLISCQIPGQHVTVPTGSPAGYRSSAAVAVAARQAVCLTRDRSSARLLVVTVQLLPWRPCAVAYTYE